MRAKTKETNFGVGVWIGVGFRRRSAQQVVGLSWVRGVTSSRRSTWVEVQNSVWGQVAAEAAANGWTHPPSVRTMQLWIHKHSTAGAIGLRPQRHRSGNRDPRFDLLFEDITLGLIDTYYLTNDRTSVRELADKVVKAYTAACAELTIAPGPCGRRAVQTVLDRIPYHEMMVRRLGKKTARLKLRFAGKIITVEAPYDRVEIDCTPLDLFVVDALGRCLGRPTLCVIIDAATGVILAMVLRLGSPTQTITAQAIYEAMTPKPEGFFEKHGVKHRFEAYGGFTVLRSDNGSENAGDLPEQAVASLGFTWNKVAPQHPERKPFVERVMREINNFVRTLPGATRSVLRPGQERIPDAMAEACLTIDQLDNKLQVWRYDVYSQRVRHRVMSPLGVAESPAASMARLSQEVILPDPPTAAQLRDMFMVSAEVRTTQHYGVTIDRIQYGGPHLKRILLRYGPGTKLDVRYNPHDIREIAVLDPETGKHVPAPCKDDTMPAISFAEAKLLAKGEAVLTGGVVAQALVDGALDAAAKGPRTKTAKAKAAEIVKRRKNEIITRSQMPPMSTAKEPDPVRRRATTLPIARPAAPAPRKNPTTAVEGPAT